MIRRACFGLAVVVCAGMTVGLFAIGRAAIADEKRPNLLAFEDVAGQVRTVNVNGAIDEDNPFFQDLGTNGRRCVSCHQPESAWTITPANVQRRFVATRGTDPIFTNNDGSNCEGVLPQTLAEKRMAYGLLLTRGLIRVGLDVPSGAEFAIDSVSDPNRCLPATNDASPYRRPLPSTNLKFLTAVMWDGRESSAATTLLQDLAKQANDATRGHAAAAPDLTPAQARQIVNFEMGLFTAQAQDRAAGNLSAHGANGSPVAVAKQPFFIGINDPVGLNPTNASFNPRAFSLFDAWRALGQGRGDDQDHRGAIARGQEIFNTKPITLSGVGGLNGQTFSNGVTLPGSFVGTCTTCHDSTNVGDHSVKAPLDIGLTDPAVAPYLPVYTLRYLTTGETVQTTDPGRPMITGQVGGYRPLQGSGASRARGAGAVLPQRFRRHARRGRRLLPAPLRHPADRTGAFGSDRVLAGPLTGSPVLRFSGSRVRVHGFGFAGSRVRVRGFENLRTCELANLRTCEPANLRTCELANLRTCEPANRRTGEPANL
jgi:cytochrome c peroxidase